MTAEPCVKCGTTGGYTPKNQNRPGRKQGMCYGCYAHLGNHGDIGQHPYINALAHPFFPAPNDLPAFNYFLWHDIRGERQEHAIFPHHFDARAEIAEARHDAARWLMEHPTADLLDWPDPSLALFGAANAREAA